MKAILALVLGLTLAALAVPAAARDVAGRFDYYVLSLSWSPTWCATDGQTGDNAQCDTGRRTAFVVHGLWPQYERGWPADCATTERPPSRRQTQAMADIMGSGGLAWYQWNKHGRCAGLSAADYFQTVRDAAAVATVPEVLRRLPRDVTLSKAVIEDAFIDANPDMTRDGITVSCQGPRLDEVRICLTRDLKPRACAPDAQRDCSRTMLLEAPR
ncbi:MAG: ribonuclease T [Paracoccus denitrificans]|nr:MAG: ribonuclease T [Paracoccus denitrificans]PZO86067.1 MAG: ribonuclease T [Paracoccus denitrificans]